MTELEKLVEDFRQLLRDARAGKLPPSYRREGSHVMVGPDLGPPTPEGRKNEG